MTEYECPMCRAWEELRILDESELEDAVQDGVLCDQCEEVVEENMRNKEAS